MTVAVEPPGIEGRGEIPLQGSMLVDQRHGADLADRGVVAQEAMGFPANLLGQPDFQRDLFQERACLQKGSGSFIWHRHGVKMA